MLKQFQSNILKKQLFDKHQKLLLAFSGGVDSTVLLHLLHHSGYTFDLAHCNFNLRGSESDGDEEFCRQIALEYGVKCYCKTFHTDTYAAEHQLSIQMAARKLRYDWFQELIKNEFYDFILTAHHANDQIETFFINLTRGTGIHGLQGIPDKQKNIVRPLLFASKTEILSYANQFQLAYRTDSSNVEVKYKRNFIRHELVPKFEKLNPDFINTMLENMTHMKASASIVEEFCQKKFQEYCTYNKEHLYIDTLQLEKDIHKNILLFTWLNPFLFNSNQVDQIIHCIESNSPSGKLFFSKTHQLVIDREKIVVSDKTKNNKELTEFVIQDINDTKHLPISLQFELSEHHLLVHQKHIAMLDYHLLKFPLILRHWKTGDKFKPLGLNGFKKVSDFFTNEKINRLEKNQIWIIESDDQIAWIVNHRIDDRFKITENTVQSIKIIFS